MHHTGLKLMSFSWSQGGACDQKNQNKRASWTTGKNEERGKGVTHVGAAPTAGGVRKAGCKELLGSPCVTLHIRRKKGAAQKRDLRSLPQAVPCFTGTEVSASTGFAF